MHLSRQEFRETTGEIRKDSRGKKSEGDGRDAERENQSKTTRTARGGNGRTSRTCAAVTERQGKGEQEGE